MSFYDMLQKREDPMVPVLKQQLRECEANLRNVIKAIRQGIISSSTKAELEALEGQRDALKSSLLQVQTDKRKFTRDEILAWLRKFKCDRIDDTEFMTDIFELFVNSVRVRDGEMVITLNYV